MKYDALRKVERNVELVQLRDRHPTWSWSDIAEQFHISRQCAHAIYMRATGRKGYGYGRKKTTVE